jgi:hypothetical protein
MTYRNNLRVAALLAACTLSACAIEDAPELAETSSAVVVGDIVINDIEPASGEKWNVRTFDNRDDLGCGWKRPLLVSGAR